MEFSPTKVLSHIQPAMPNQSPYHHARSLQLSPVRTPSGYDSHLRPPAFDTGHGLHHNSPQRNHYGENGDQRHHQNTPQRNHYGENSEQRHHENSPQRHHQNTPHRNHYGGNGEQSHHQNSAQKVLCSEQGEHKQHLERVMMGSPQMKASPKRQFPPYISCMFAPSPHTSPGSPAPPSSPLLSSPASTTTSASSPYYHHHHHFHYSNSNSNSTNNNNNKNNNKTKRQLLWKEKNPSSAPAMMYYPSSPSPAAPHYSPHNPQAGARLHHSHHHHLHNQHHRSRALSPGKMSSLSHCKRRLDFNHNPVQDIDVDMNLNDSFVSGATHTLDEQQVLSLGSALSPQLVQPTLQGDAATLGRVPAVAVARRNERERNRVKLINMTFATLREHLPNSSGTTTTNSNNTNGNDSSNNIGGGGGNGIGSGNGNKCGKSRKMSKVETLRAAIEYIRELHALIKEKQQQQQESSKENDHLQDVFHKDKDHLREVFHKVLKVEAVDMEVDEGCLVTSGSSSSSRPPLSSTSSSLEMGSPRSSAGGAHSPVSDDGCFTYDLLSTEDEDLLEFASNWF